MANSILDGAEIEISSGNVFADLGLPGAEQLKIKSGLVIEITRAVRRLGLTQEEAQRRLEKNGPNVVAREKHHTWIGLLGRAMINPLVVLLLVLAMVHDSVNRLLVYGYPAKHKVSV